MSQLESAVTPLLRDLEATWPLDDRQKGTLAEFIALQHVRSPRWRAFHDDFLSETLHGWATEATSTAELPAGEPLREQDITRLGRHLRSSTQRSVKMLSLLGKLASIFGSMHWTPLRFEKPLLATYPRGGAGSGTESAS